MKTLTAASLAVAILALSGAAFAQVQYEESPQNVAVELRVGPYYVNKIDSEFSGDGPYQSLFDGDPAWTFGLELDWQIWHGFGSIGVFGNASWGFFSGKGWDVEENTLSADETTLSLVPVALGAVYRFDVLAKRWNVPIVLALKLGLSYTFWWVKNGVEEVTDASLGGSSYPGYGGTWGLHWGASLHFLLDFFEPHTAKIFDNEIGVNNSYLFVEYVGYWSNDFGSDASWDLSHNGVVFGLAFEM